MTLGALSWHAASTGDARLLPGIWRRHRRRLLWSSPVALAALAVAILTLLAATYQPLQPGAGGGPSFPGLRTGTDIRWVYQYIPNGPDLYVPTQRGQFTLATYVVNRGSFPVTIVGVTQQPGSPFTAAGPARYLTSAEDNPGSQTRPPRHVLRNITLGPGQAILIGMPLQIAYCADRRSYVGEEGFLVTERFLGFTHTVPIPFVDEGRPVLTNAPGGQPGRPGTFCS